MLPVSIAIFDAPVLQSDQWYLYAHSRKLSITLLYLSSILGSSGTFVLAAACRVPGKSAVPAERTLPILDQSSAFCSVHMKDKKAEIMFEVEATEESGGVCDCCGNQTRTV